MVHKVQESRIEGTIKLIGQTIVFWRLSSPWPDSSHSLTPGFTFCTWALFAAVEVNGIRSTAHHLVQIHSSGLPIFALVLCACNEAIPVQAKGKPGPLAVSHYLMMRMMVWTTLSFHHLIAFFKHRLKVTIKVERLTSTTGTSDWC